MNRFLTATLLGISVCGALPTQAQTSNIPTPKSSGLELGGLLRASLGWDNLTLMAHASATRLVTEQNAKNMSAGFYWKPWRNFKLGAFWARASGLRHDNDWVRENGQWGWVDTSSRYETFWVFDITPQGEISFLPGSNWTAELKTRYAINRYNQQKTLRVRPGLSYFWQHNGRPFMRFIAQYEAYIPLNYGVSKLYESWIYQGVFWQLNDSFELGATVSEKSLTWASTSDYTTLTGNTYKIKQNSIEVGINTHFRFEL